MLVFEKVSYDAFRKDVLKAFGKWCSEEDIEAAYKAIKLPERADAGSAGYDFRTPFYFSLTRLHRHVRIPTGIKAKMGAKSVLLVLPRSGKGCSTGYHLTNTVGVIDSSYYGNADNEGDIIVCLSRGHKNASFGAGDRFVQGVVLRFESSETGSDAEKLSKRKRSGGFGSSGK